MIPGVTPQQPPRDAYSDGEWALGIPLFIFVVAAVVAFAACLMDLVDMAMEAVL